MMDFHSCSIFLENKCISAFIWFIQEFSADLILRQYVYGCFYKCIWNTAFGRFRPINNGNRNPYSLRKPLDLIPKAGQQVNCSYSSLKIRGVWIKNSPDIFNSIKDFILNNLLYIDLLSCNGRLNDRFAYLENRFPYHPSIRIHKIHRIVIAVDIRTDAGILVSQRIRGCPAGKVTELASLLP